MVRAVRFDEHVDDPPVVVVRPTRPTEHLLELLDREPLDAHGERVEDDLRGGEVDPRSECRRGDHRREVLVAELSFDALPAAVVETGVVRGRRVLQFAADLVTPPARVGEDDGLAAVALRGLPVELPFHQFVLDVRLLLSVREGDVPLDGHRALLELDERRLQPTRQPLGIPDGRREIYPLRAVERVDARLARLAVVFESRDEPVEAVPAALLFQRVNLVDDDRPHVPEVLPGAERVVDALVGADDDVRVRVERRAVVVDATRAHANRHVDEVAVPILKVLVFLVGECDQRDEKE